MINVTVNGTEQIKCNKGDNLYQVLTAAGYWLFGFASKKYHPLDDLDAEKWQALNLKTNYYTTRLHKGAFYLPAFLERLLEEVE